MAKIDRRTMITSTAAAGIAVSAAVTGLAGEDDVPKTDRERVLAIGFTAEEADCWASAAKAAGEFFRLPELHPMDKQEVAQAIHVLQNKLLGRPAYRKYLELSKAAAAKTG